MREGARLPVRTDGGGTDHDDGDDPDHDDGDDAAPRDDRDGRSEPLSDLARRVRERRERRSERSRTDTDGTSAASPVDTDAEHSGSTIDVSDAFGDVEEAGGAGAGTDVDDLFEEEDVADVDAERVWESLVDEDDEDEEDVPVGDSLSVEIDERVERTGSDEHVVPKRDYCESCRFFSDPPEVACTYEGAHIVEVVDGDRFRVRHCPVVAGIVDTEGRHLDDSE